MPWSDQGGSDGWQGPAGGGQPPDLEELLKKGQDRLRQALPGGSLGGKGIAIGVLILAAVWAASGFYRVEPDEQGVVMRFGKFVNTTQPGLNYHMPFPIESAMTPKVLFVNKVEVGMRGGVNDARGRAGAVRDVPEESLMLTGDENIVDVDFIVFWVIKDAAAYLFNRLLICLIFRTLTKRSKPWRKAPCVRSLVPLKSSPC